MKCVIKKWGNSAAVRIPAPIMQAAGLAPGDAVEMREEGGRIVIAPAGAASYELATLVGRISPANIHEPANFGMSTGTEVW